ncbi:MAG: hypothetical protein AAGF11_26095 [Myxococcota bacterium]
MSRSVLAGVVVAALLVGIRPVMAAAPSEASSGASPDTSPDASSDASSETSSEASPDTAPRSERQPGDRMVQAGVGFVVASLVGYGLMAAGLGIGNRAENDLRPLWGREDIERRREVIARGQMGNRLAIGGAIAATAAMAVGIPLIIIGRRRHQAHASSATLTLRVGGAGGAGGSFGLHMRGRF